MAVIPVPASRATELLMQTRLLAQAQSQQLDLLRLQDQLSSGQRISRPSEDAPSAARAIRLQGLLERKEQSRVNLESTREYLAVSENALASMTNLLNDVRGLAITATDSTLPETDRQAMVIQIEQATQQILAMANQRYRERYLFAGSRSTVPPLVRTDQFISFQGNAQSLPSFVDLDLLANGNVTADRPFGVFSDGVQVSVDLNPILNGQIRLEQLNGGLGVTRGSFIISDGNVSSTVDIREAVTLDDVVRLIESNPPPGREIVARVGMRGLTVELIDDDKGGNLRILEVASGKTASELGIFNSSGVGTAPLVGADLNPRLLPTTSLRDILGTRASGLLQIPGDNNDIHIEAVARGAEYNGLAVHLVDDDALLASAGIGVGNEYVTYSESAQPARAALTFSGLGNNLLLTANTPGTQYNGVAIEVVDAGAIGNNAVVAYDAENKRLTIGVDSFGQTQVQTVVAQIGANTPFTATYDASVAADGGYVPTAIIQAADAGVVTGTTSNTGSSGPAIFVHIVPGSSSANGVLAALESSPIATDLITARLDVKETSAFVSPGQGQVAASPEAAVELSGGSGEELDQTSGIRIENGGEVHDIDLSNAETIQDLLNRLNGSGAQVLAEINASGTGLNIRSRLSGAELSIGENGGRTATQLGLRSFHADIFLSDLNYGRGVERVDGPELTITRPDGVELAIDLDGAATVQDVLDAINNHPLNLDPAARIEARLAEYGNGIELINQQITGPTPLTVTPVRGSAAWDLGLVAKGANSADSSGPPEAAAALVSFPPPNDVNTALRIDARATGSQPNGTQVVFVNTGAVIGDDAAISYDASAGVLTIDIDPASTTAATVVAQFAADPDFVAAVDTSSDPTNDGSGVIGFVGTAATLEGGAAEVLAGSDPHPQEVNGTFNTMLKLARAVADFDVGEIERTAGMLAEDLDRLNYARGEIGAQQRFLDNLQQRLEDEDVELRKTLSVEIDTDLLATISTLTGRQAALQASLQLMGRSMQLTLLDYL